MVLIKLGQLQMEVAGVPYVKDLGKCQDRTEGTASEWIIEGSGHKSGAEVQPVARANGYANRNTQQPRPYWPPGIIEGILL